MEEWRTIPGFEAYEASSLGRIRRRTAYNSVKAGRIKSAHLNRHGYLQVSLWIGDGHGHWCHVHNLVCRAFHGLPPTPAHEARHLNSNNRIDNVPSNLAWGTKKENGEDKVRHGTTAKGSRNGAARLTEAQAIEIIEAGKRGMRGKDLAPLYGVDPSTINRLISGKKWKHLHARTS